MHYTAHVSTRAVAQCLKARFSTGSDKIAFTTQTGGEKLNHCCVYGNLQQGAPVFAKEIETRQHGVTTFFLFAHHCGKNGVSRLILPYSCQKTILSTATNGNHSMSNKIKRLGEWENRQKCFWSGNRNGYDTIGISRFNKQIHTIII